MEVNIFFCYAHEDEDLLNKLKRHLWPLQRQGLIAVRHDRDISAGTEWEQEIKQHLNEADIILLLVSPDFMYSEYCYGVELKRALERHQRGEARVIPIILRPVYWQGILGTLQALPTDAKPVRSWSDIDEAFFDVAEGIRKVVEKLGPIRPEYLSLLSTLIGHTDIVSSVAFSPDGQTLASGSWDQTIKLWNMTTGQELRTLTGHSNHVLRVAFSSDGLTLASCSRDQTIKLWNVTTGQEVRTLIRHTGYIPTLVRSDESLLFTGTVVFSPDGQILATGSRDQKIKLWNVATGQELRTLTGHTDTVERVVFNPDGLTLFSCSYDHTIKLWNVATGQELRTLTGHVDGIYSIAISPDGLTLASGGVDHTIKLWNVVTGEEVRTLTGGIPTVWSLAFSPDSQTLASCGADQTIKLWNVVTGEEVCTLTGDTYHVHTVVFSPDGQTLVSGGHDRTIMIWGNK